MSLTNTPFNYTGCYYNMVWLKFKEIRIIMEYKINKSKEPNSQSEQIRMHLCPKGTRFRDIKQYLKIQFCMVCMSKSGCWLSGWFTKSLPPMWVYEISSKNKMCACTRTRAHTHTRDVCVYACRWVCVKISKEIWKPMRGRNNPKEPRGLFSLIHIYTHYKVADNLIS